MEPIFKFTKDDLLKVIAKFCADNLTEYDQEKTALQINYNDNDEIEVYLVELSSLN